MPEFNKIIENIKFNDDGLVPVITQDSESNEVLMLAWMNGDALKETLKSRNMCYFSRSRGKLWKKGETSGQTQLLKELLIDCDSDTILAKVAQTGVACHTGRRGCFFNSVKGIDIEVIQDIITPPEELYGE